jgi:hypothetical protein
MDSASTVSFTASPYKTPYGDLVGVQQPYAPFYAVRMERQMSTEHRSEAAVGWTWFAGFMMILLGSFWAMAGLVGIFEDDFFVATPDYVFKFDVTTWGWIHLILGIVVVLAGLALFQGALWARTVGVVLALLSAVVGFAWLPWYPIWGIILVTVAIFVIWSLTVHGRDVTKFN